MKRAALALIAVLALAACGKKGAETAAAPPANATTTTTTVTTNTTAPAMVDAAAPPPAAPAGFNPAAAPAGQAPTGKWPYFGLVNGYAKGTIENAPSSDSRKYWIDAPYDRYDFFDGTKTIPVEGRIFTTLAIGKGASFFQIQKTYEKLVHDLGGVTVYEGTGAPMNDNKIKFADPRFRANYRVQDDKMGVYMLTTPTSQVWVEVYRPWEDNSENYWVTILETKPLEVKMTALSSDELKRELDAKGQVALYINFDTDKTTIKSDSAAIVAQVVKLLNDNPSLNLVVEGHTDNQGAAPHNQTLSEGRANSVVGALMAQGIAMSRLQPKGFGQTKPLADNGTEDGRAKNRRVELVKR